MGSHGSVQNQGTKFKQKDVKIVQNGIKLLIMDHTSFLLGTNASICLKCCSESTSLSHAKTASLILSNGSFKCPRRIAVCLHFYW